MPGDTETATKTAEASNFEEALANISKKIDEKMEGYGEKLSSFGKELDEIKRKPAEAHVVEDDEDEEENSSSDEEFVTNKKINKIIPKLKAEIAREAQKAAQAMVEHKTNQNKRDTETLKEFPLLDRNSSEYDKVFEQEVVREMDRRVRAGRGNDDPELLYDSSAVIFSRWSRAGKYAPKRLAEREADEMDRREDSFSVKGKSKPETGKLNERQVALAQKWGMNMERLKTKFGK